MEVRHNGFKGLTDAEIEASRSRFGPNKLTSKRTSGFWIALKSTVKEPMVLLLFAASLIYFLSGEIGDAVFLASAIVVVAAISLYQDSKSRMALEKLKDLSQPAARVVRNGIEEEIRSEEIVVGDTLIVEEGTAVTADGTILQANDFSVNESVLTGESMTVFKDAESEDRAVYMGTHVATGLAVLEVTAVGNNTELGKLGQQLGAIKESKTPLEMQIGNFVKWMVLAGTVVFLIVWAMNYARTGDILESLLQALTLAMSILPEEIPVAFTTFMALGAWRLMKTGVVVKAMKTVETLGSATVICTDKTGTITENKMEVARLYLADSDEIVEPSESLSDASFALIRLAMWASEPIPFDPMEISLHKLYAAEVDQDERSQFNMVHEYPLGGKPPMMTHVFENNQGHRIIAAKGAPEAFWDIAGLSEAEKNRITAALSELGKEGFRVLGVAEAVHEGNEFPSEQQDLKFEFKGLVAFYDPPKKNIESVLNQFYTAGIKVKIITGDNELTTRSIARQIGFRGSDDHISGAELMALNNEELEARVRDTFVFTRMFPEAKMRIVDALKAQGEIVAMTGDGVNDAPALKSAHIGIAMGKRGTEIARQAASLILLDDDLSKMVEAVAMGRRIYANLKKAIQYIISIHIPIILVVFIPLAFGWVYPNIFSPVHIIFLELIMGPTCSIIYENEPIETGSMEEKPRPFSQTFFNRKELFTSILQGLVIAVGVLLVYRFATYNHFTADLTRTMVFVTLIFANIILTLVNRSFFYSAFTTLRYQNNLVPIIISITILLTAAIVYIVPMAQFFDFETLNVLQLSICAGVGMLSVLWYELVKGMKRIRQKKDV
jgi:Ca2+-transporting ATPase